ncbi:MAG: BrnT family toxin [Alphaproteobacteria bacterium]|nr:BrnT family toxin [Alphaproteobacteria bacterium]
MIDEYTFSEEKDHKLRNERGIGFKEIITYLESGNIVDVISHPNLKKYPQQWYYMINIEGYIWAVPHEYRDGKIHLITAFQNRKANKTYGKKKK